MGMSLSLTRSRHNIDSSKASIAKTAAMPTIMRIIVRLMSLTVLPSIASRYHQDMAGAHQPFTDRESVGLLLSHRKAS